MVRARGLEPPWRVGKALRTDTEATQTTIVPDQIDTYSKRQQTRAFARNRENTRF